VKPGFTELVPTNRESVFLQACLHDGARGLHAWNRWLDEATRDSMPVRRVLAGVNALLPLLAWSLRRNRAVLEPNLETHLRSASLTEELRWRQYRNISAALFRQLSEARVPFIALGGAAVGEGVYPAPELRHSDGIDVLLLEHDLDRATDCLLRAGWRRGTPHVLPSPLRRSPLVQADGVNAGLHWRLAVPYYTLPHDDLWARSRLTSVAGVEVRVLADEDAVLHASLHGWQHAPDPRWVADVWFMLHKWEGLDWRLLENTITSARLELPLHAALCYLAGPIGAPVPAEILDRLEARARRTGFVGRSAARPWPGDAGDVRRAHDGVWRRVNRVWRRGFPPPVQLVVHYGVPWWAVPFWYVYRLAGYAWWRCKA
jgi:hypothetical protein